MRRPKTNSASPEQARLWLMFPPKLIREPLIWKLGQKFPIVTNIRQASVTDEIGIVSLELDGKRADVKAALRDFSSWSIRHVRRAQNADADRLVNEALDGG